MYIYKLQNVGNSNGETLINSNQYKALRKNIYMKTLYMSEEYELYIHWVKNILNIIILSQNVKKYFLLRTITSTQIELVSGLMILSINLFKIFVLLNLKYPSTSSTVF